MGNIWSCISPLINCLTPCAGDWILEQVNHVIKFEDNLDRLKSDLYELKRIRKDLQTRVAVAEEQPMMQRLRIIHGWLSDFQNMEIELNEVIENGSEEIEKNFCCGCPKNCCSRYELGKKVAKKLQDAAALKSNGVFGVVAQSLPSPPATIRPSEGIIVGMKNNFSEIWGHLKKEDVGIIGIYGLGGVGKTTLLTEVNNMFVNTTHDFDVVIWVTMSGNQDLNQVQNDIGKRIGLYDEMWKNKRPEGKKEDICGVLSKKKFVLLLDDMWERLDLLEVGIPLQDMQNFKIVFTTYSQEVCDQMDAQKTIEVECLQWGEAWDLFQKKVGETTLNSNPDIPELAKLVAEECDGFPLALITVGRAMAHKQTPQAWKHAITVLKNYAMQFPGMETKVFGPLLLSYDSLPSDTVKSCFLYCSLYPKDSDIIVEDLINKWIGEGFLNERNDNEVGAENQGCNIIDTLLQACFLEKVSSDTVKMHDMTRKMALWICCEYEKQTDKFLVRAGGREIEAPEVSKWKEVKRMSLMVNKIKKLIEIPTCPQLTTLLLNDNRLEMISSGFFQSMHALKVLDLSWNLRLYYLPLEIGELTSLQYLNISRTKISRLPVQLQKLVNLKILDMEYTYCDQTSILQVISGLSSLQVLKINAVFIDNETLVEKLDALKFLYYLSMTMANASVFQRLQKCHKLQSCTRYFQLQSCKRCITFNISSLQYMKCLNSLDVLDLEACEDWVIDWTVKGKEIETSNNPLDSRIRNRPCFHSLQKVWIANCRKLKNAKWLLFAPNIESLSIISCDNMEEVISGDAWTEAAEEGKIPKPFAKMETLNFNFLPQLKSIYHSPLPFPSLKFLKVSMCPKLKKLPLNSDSAKGHRTVITGSRDWFDKLEWQDGATRNAFFPGSHIYR